MSVVTAGAEQLMQVASKEKTQVDFSPASSLASVFLKKNIFFLLLRNDILFTIKYQIWSELAFRVHCIFYSAAYHYENMKTWTYCGEYLKVRETFVIYKAMMSQVWDRSQAP